MSRAGDLDYGATLEVLAEWAGDVVEVVARHAGTGATHVTLSGRLGTVRMVDGPGGRTFAAHPVGSAPPGRTASGLHLHGADFAGAALRSADVLEVVLRGGMAVRVVRVRDPRAASALDNLIGAG